MLFGYFWGDWTILIVIPALILTLWAQARVSSAYNRYSNVRNMSGLTGAEAARRILAASGITDIKIEHIGGQMTDHYDPRARVIRLSDGVHDVASIAAVGIAAHEAGHAVQHETGYAGVKWRTALVPVCRIGSVAAMPLFLIGLLLTAPALILAGIVAYSLVTLFQLVTLPVEFDASRRAIETLDGSGYLVGDEVKGCRRVLNAAAMTYVAALATSLLTLVRLLVLANGRRR